MENLPTNQTWPQPSTPSKERLATIVAQMMAPKELNHRTPLVSPSDANEVITAIEARGDVKMREDKAHAAAKTLMGLFPAKAFNDPEIFVTGLAALLAAYDPEFVNRACNPVDGVATKVKFTLTLADVKEALETERLKRLSLLSTARWMIREHERREAEAKEREASKLTPEEQAERTRQVDALLRVRPMADDEGKESLQ